MVDSLDNYSDECQIGLAGDVVVIVTESSGRNFYMSFLSDIENLN